MRHIRAGGVCGVMRQNNIILSASVFNGLLCLIFIITFTFPLALFANDNSLSNIKTAEINSHRKTINIGVLAHRGIEKTIEKWTPTADYLSRRITDYHFKIKPLSLDTISNAVLSGSVDFILTNPASYASLEATHGISRIATLRNRKTNGVHTLFGAIIFTRADRTDITTINDLMGKRFMAGGWPGEN